MIDESPNMHGYTYDWKHTLLHWVSFHYGNQAQLNISDVTDVQNSKSQPLPETSIKPKARAVRYHLKYFKPVGSVFPPISKKRTRIRPEMLKCHFCNLKYFVEAERKDHEKFWHADQIN